MPAGEHEAVASARQAVERRAHTVPVKFRSWTADAGSSIKRLNLLSGRSQRTHRTKEGSNLAPIGDRLCAVATVPEGIPIALGRPRRQAAVQPAAAGAPKGNRNRRWAGSGRNTCESCISIDVRLWQRQGRLRGHQCFPWSWKCGGEPSGNINVRTEQDAIVLVYRARSYGETEWKDIEQRVPITWTACHLGGRRPWFVCSVYKSGRYCGRRVAVLYGAGQLFACRGCYGLAYLSQQQSPRDRNLSRAQKIRMKLGGSPSLAEPFPPRPRGMHTRTYVRFKACAQASEATSWAPYEIVAGPAEVLISDVDGEKADDCFERASRISRPLRAREVVMSRNELPPLLSPPPPMGHNGGPALNILPNAGSQRRPGRPTVSAPELRDRIFELLLDGVPLRVRCRAGGMPSRAANESTGCWSAVVPKWPGWFSTCAASNWLG